MSGLSGYTASMPDDVLLDSGVIMVGGNVIGVTRGGLKFDPKKTVEAIPFDGMRAAIVGLDRLKKMDPSISGKFLQYGASNIVNWEPTLTSASGGAGVATVYTPGPAGILYAPGAYLTDVRLVFERASGIGYTAVLFPKALVTKYDIQSKDESEAEISCEFLARLDMAASGALITDSPYKIELRTALPTS